MTLPPESVTSNSATPPSVTVAPVMLTAPRLSLSRIVTVAVPVPMSTPEPLDSVTVNVSLPSTSVSSIVRIVTVRVPEPVKLCTPDADR